MKMSESIITQRKFEAVITKMVEGGLELKLYNAGECEILEKCANIDQVVDFAKTAFNVEACELMISDSDWMMFVNKIEGIELSDYSEHSKNIASLFNNEIKHNFLFSKRI